MDTQEQEQLLMEHKQAAEKFKRFFSSKLNEPQKNCLGYTAEIVDSKVKAGISIATSYISGAVKAETISQRQGDKVVRRTLIQNAMDHEITSLKREGHVCPKVGAFGGGLIDLIGAIHAHGKT